MYQSHLYVHDPACCCSLPWRKWQPPFRAAKWSEFSHCAVAEQAYATRPDAHAVDGPFAVGVLMEVRESSLAAATHRRLGGFVGRELLHDARGRVESCHHARLLVLQQYVRDTPGSIGRGRLPLIYDVCRRVRLGPLLRLCHGHDVGRPAVILSRRRLHCRVSLLCSQVCGLQRRGTVVGVAGEPAEVAARVCIAQVWSRAQATTRNDNPLGVTGYNIHAEPEYAVSCPVVLSYRLHLHTLPRRHCQGAHHMQCSYVRIRSAQTFQFGS